MHAERSRPRSEVRRSSPQLDPARAANGRVAPALSSPAPRARPGSVPRPRPGGEGARREHASRRTGATCAATSITSARWGSPPGSGSPGAEIQAHLAELVRRGLSPRSQARALSAIRSLPRAAVAEKLTPPTPTDEIDSPRPGRPLPALLSHDEVDRLLRRARTPRTRRPGGATGPCSSCSTPPGCASPSSSRSG